MTQTRRMGVEGSTRRTLFVDAAEALLRSEGYMSLSARQVAARAGLKTQLLYYYFRTMDDLVLDVVRRINARRLQKFEEALAAPEPLRALWELNSDPSGAAMSAELTAMAGHREAVRTEIVQAAQHFRALQVEAATRLLGKQAGKDYPAAGIVMIAIGVARTMVSESSLGLTDGHREAQMIIERLLQAFSKG
ncbi:TetR/AcrR family transcriptional regulator [Solimonas terrae]|uniref:TetR/AcrR family transcriptional regulator n=1 Tax=Solimonas terrae TaxID=1396819 RepID=A0A6M2BP77_9GAMM|nr:TetR family transcriptional regulator [Solimonas terrae]NGY04035.1 TetR/AcrR family transcriptional regulator [Solimonas terrae]